MRVPNMGQAYYNNNNTLLCGGRNGDGGGSGRTSYDSEKEYCSTKRPEKTDADCSSSNILVSTKDIVCRINLKWLTLFAMSLPLYALIACLAISMNMHFEEVMNNTWCPQMEGNHYASISIVVSIYYPERFIWEFAIIIHAVPRLFIAFGYRHYYLLYENYRKRRPAYRIGVHMIAYAHTLEVACLVILSIIGINDSFPIHCTAFITMLVAAATGMITNVIMHGCSGAPKLSRAGKRAFWVKLGLVSIMSLIIAVISVSYWSYVYYCQSWAYPTFTVCEYIVVFFIIAFHGASILDMPDRMFIIFAGSKLTHDYSIPAVY